MSLDGGRPYLYLTGECRNPSGESSKVEARTLVSEEVAEKIIRAIDLHRAFALGHLRLFLVVPQSQTAACNADSRPAERMIRVPAHIAADIMALAEARTQAEGSSETIDLSARGDNAAI